MYICIRVVMPHTSPMNVSFGGNMYTYVYRHIFVYVFIYVYGPGMPHTSPINVSFGGNSKDVILALFLYTIFHMFHDIVPRTFHRASTHDRWREAFAPVVLAKPYVKFLSISFVYPVSSRTLPSSLPPPTLPTSFKL